MSTRLKLSAAVLALALPLAWPALSAGGDSGSGASDQTPTCKSGEVYDKTEKKCVPAKQGAVDDDSLFETGRALAYAGKYGEAIQMLGLVSDKNDPRVLNMLGFSHRKSGRIDVGLGYYQEALTINPDFTLAREYLGEAYLTLGDIASAKNQLSEIEKRCGKGCAEYAALEKQIAAVGG
ncbi:tetratricopeptide repeat protein [Mesorhizobium australicum]|uniref:Tetratricopeptide repeat-containing protein n=1 Tax=Mesorhizobium australicum TaxID=536018 RepID=A0A1X7PL38_9HYPH|nr:tetratricopeptide repeat protein [Mesorhizobium australicum]SMH51472.1 Tetratricopeptide repeat-containing protein [Mesorhizobium australicum]